MKQIRNYYYAVEGSKIRVYSVRDGILHLECELDVPYYSIILLELEEHIKSDSYQIIFIKL